MSAPGLTWMVQAGGFSWLGPCTYAWCAPLLSASAADVLCLHLTLKILRWAGEPPRCRLVVVLALKSEAPRSQAEPLSKDPGSGRGGE